MLKYVNVNEEGRIGVTTDKEEWAGPDAFQFNFPEDFDFAKQNEYVIQDGELLYSPPEPDPSARISELKAKLKETDYIIMKISESQVTGVAISEEEANRYSDILPQRQQWRDEINELEAQL